VPDDPNETLPRGELLRPQGTADIGEHQQLVRPPVLAVHASPHLPASCRSGKTQGQRAGRRPYQTLLEPELGRRPTEHPCSAHVQEPLACTVDQTQRAGRVEREHGHVDLPHDLAHESRGLEVVDPLLTQPLGKGVDLDDDLAEWIGAITAAQAKGEVPLAQGRQQVGHRSEVEARAHVCRPCQPQPGSHHHNHQKLAQAARQGALREQHQRDEHTRKTGPDDREEQPTVDAPPLHSPYFSSLR